MADYDEPEDTRGEGNILRDSYQCHLICQVVHDIREIFNLTVWRVEWEHGIECQEYALFDYFMCSSVKWSNFEHRPVLWD